MRANATLTLNGRELLVDLRGDRGVVADRGAQRTPDDRCGDRRVPRDGVSTVSGILTRIEMGRVGRLGLEPAQRYARARPTELRHLDIKKLGRIPDGCSAQHTAPSIASTGYPAPRPTRGCGGDRRDDILRQSASHGVHQLRRRG
jgi:hypothetical protein